MAITFIKPARFDPKIVKHMSFDIDNNWTVKDLNYDKLSKDNRVECVDYDFILHSNKLNEDSPKTRITIRNNRGNGPNNPTNMGYIEYLVRPADDDYYHTFTERKPYQRNICIHLCELVKNIEFIKGVFHMRRCTQREVIKKFGRVFGRH